MSVLDASAVLALVNGEPGAEAISARLDGAVMSTVNAIEVGTRLVDKGLSFEEASEALQLLDIPLVDFDTKLALQAVFLRKATRHRGLSLADRACLALALRERTAAITCDQAWSGLELGCQIELIR